MVDVRTPAAGMVDEGYYFTMIERRRGRMRRERKTDRERERERENVTCIKGMVSVYE
jgi:hypothetical protein